MVALPTPGMIASKPANVARQSARATLEIPNPSLAFIPFPPRRSVVPPTADAAESDKSIREHAAATVLIPQAMSLYSRSQDFPA
jgi:hypothetical protein